MAACPSTLAPALLVQNHTSSQVMLTVLTQRPRAPMAVAAFLQQYPGLKRERSNALLSCQKYDISIVSHLLPVQQKALHWRSAGSWSLIFLWRRLACMGESGQNRMGSDFEVLSADIQRCALERLDRCFHAVSRRRAKPLYSLQKFLDQPNRQLLTPVYSAGTVHRCEKKIAQLLETFLRDASDGCSRRGPLPCHCLWCLTTRPVRDN